MNTFTLRPFAVALTLAMACATAAHAAEPATAAATVATLSSSLGGPVLANHHLGGPQASAHKHRSVRDALVIPGIGRLGAKHVAALKLSADQQTLLQASRDAQRTLHQSMRQAAHARHDQLAAQLAANNLDPRALSVQSDATHGKFKAERGAVRDKWLALWDSFSPEQRQTVQTFVTARQAKIEKHRSRAVRSDSTI